MTQRSVLRTLACVFHCIHLSSCPLDSYVYVPTRHILRITWTMGLRLLFIGCSNGHSDDTDDTGHRVL